MNSRTAGCAACAVVAGAMLLSGCATAPANQAAAARASKRMDVSQVPPLDSPLYISESAAVARPQPPAPSADDLARAAMKQQTQGMAPGQVTGGPQGGLVLDLSSPPNQPQPAGLGPKPVIPALQPDALSRPPVEEKTWKKPLPPLTSLENK